MVHLVTYDNTPRMTRDVKWAEKTLCGKTWIHETVFKGGIVEMRARIDRNHVNNPCEACEDALALRELDNVKL